MKFLGSILILAGFFALNDASLTYEEQMRLVNDQLLLEDLQRIAENRDTNSLECSKKLIDALSNMLNNYNTEMGFCNQTKEDTIAALEKGAKKLIKSYSKTLISSCNAIEACASLATPDDSLTCYEEQGSEDATILTNISNDAATSRSQLKKDIEDAGNTEELCKTQAYASYSDQSTQANDEFSKCVKDKSEPKPVTTEAPAEENDEKDEGAEGERPKFRANKYRRF